MTGNNGKAKAPTWEVKQNGSKKAKADEAGPRRSTRRLTRKGVEPARPGRPGQARLGDHEPRRLGRLQDGGRRDPGGWSQLATDIVVSQVLPQGRPPRRREAGRDERPPGRLPHRAHHPRGGRDASAATSRRKEDADAFEAELSLPAGPPVRRVQLAGLVQLRPLPRATASTGSGGNWAWDDEAATRSSRPTNAYERPQCSACFIQAVDDDLMGIYELVKNEARLFKYGSGTGTNFSAHPRQAGEALGRRHVESGLMSFLEVLRSRGGRDQDAAAPRGAPRRWSASTWTTRRSSTSSTGRCARRRRRSALIARGLPERLQRRGLPHGQRPELEQLGPRHRRLHEAPSQAGGKWQTHHAHDRRGRARRSRRKDLWRHGRRGRVGAAPIRACSTTRTINQLAHLPEHRDASTRRIRAPSTCSSTTRPATSSSLNLTKFLERGRQRSTSRATATRSAIFFIAQEILVDFSTLPDREDRAELARLPPARPRLREPRHAADAAWASRTTPTRAARSRRRSPRSCAATPTASSAEMAASKGPFPGFAKNREPMLRVMRMHRDAAYAIDRDKCPERALARGLRGLGRRGAARRAARLPQRAGHRARADRHDRPADGLRHDRHRARLRAREVQEARRRRLLQDRQPVGARARSRKLGYGEARDRRRSSRYVIGHEHARSARRTSTAQTLKERGLTDAELAKVEAALPGVVRARPRVRAVGPRRGRLRAARRHEGSCDAAAASTSSSTSASREPRSTRRTTSSSAA